MFTKMYSVLLVERFLVTYSAAGSVKRSLIALGFKVEKLPVPLWAKGNDKGYKSKIIK